MARHITNREQCEYTSNTWQIKHRKAQLIRAIDGLVQVLNTEQFPLFARHGKVSGRSFKFAEKTRLRVKDLASTLHNNILCSFCVSPEYTTRHGPATQPEYVYTLGHHLHAVRVPHISLFNRRGKKKKRCCLRNFPKVLEVACLEARYSYWRNVGISMDRPFTHLPIPSLRVLPL